MGAVDGLVTHAGLALGLQPAQKAVLDNWDTLIDTNNQGLLYMTRAVLPGMVARDRGHVVNMGSVAALYAYPGGNVYGATKAAATGFTRSLAREVGKLGVTVNAIAPGFVDTELTQSLSEDQRKRIAGRSALRRLPEPDDVARMVEYLLGDGGRNITGSVLTIDAGNTA